MYHNAISGNVLMVIFLSHESKSYTVADLEVLIIYIYRVILIM